MPERYDAVVLGLGGMGSAALARLAARGRHVLGLEQFHPAHALGSSHGGSRIIRKAYYEDPAYVPLLLRAYELWSDLERQTGTRLFLRSGGLMAGPEGCEVVQGSVRSARTHGLAHELLSSAEIRRRYPVMRPRDDEVAVYEPDAGILFPERCVLAHLQAAVAAGAEARFGTPVLAWQPNPDGVTVITATGEIRCAALIICAGAWLGTVAADLGLPLQVERNVTHWFDPASQAEQFAPTRFPVYLLQRQDSRMLYGMPLLEGEGVKAAFHYSGQATTPSTIDRIVSTDEVTAIRQALADWIPAAAGAWRRSAACMYTNTPDAHFLIGRHPHHPRVLLAGGFSGHGFKFCPVIAEILADLAIAGATAHPIELFSPARFMAPRPTC